MGKHLFDTTLAAQSLRRILHQQLLDEVLALITHVNLISFGVGEGNLPILYHVVHFVCVVTLGVEGGAADQHLVGKDADGPPVHWEGVTLVAKDLWRDIVRRPAESLCLLVPFEHLSEPKISKAEIAILIHQNILRFEVPIDDLLPMEMADSHDHLHRVEADSVLLEAVVFPQMPEKFTSPDESHHKEYFGRRLEYVFHADEEGVISHEENVLL